jgi:integrase
MLNSRRRSLKTYAEPTLEMSMSFDARAAKQLSPGEHFTMPDCPGLRFEVSASTRAWIYRYKNGEGKMRQVKLGEWPAMSANVAKVEWEKLRDLRAGGRDPAAERRADRQAERAAQEQARAMAARRKTVRTLIEQYLERHIDRQRKAKGAAEARRMLEKVLDENPDFAQLDPTLVTRATAFNLLQGYVDTPVQAGKIRAELGAAWDHAHDAGELDEEVPNWWRQIMRGKLRSKGHVREGESIGTAKRVLNPEEIGTLIRWLPNFSRLVEDVVTVYLWTCTRGSEILSMEARDITREDDGLWWTVPKQKTKNAWRDAAVDLRVPLVGRARDIVLRRLEAVGSGYLFPSEGKSGHVEQKTISAMVWMHQPYAKTRPAYVRPRLPVSHWSVHDLRRTGRTQLAALGCSEEVAEAVLGHMPAGIVGVYNLHRYDSERRDWLMKLSEHYEKLAKI